LRICTKRKGGPFEPPFRYGPNGFIAEIAMPG
jgi:hypothetical protein